MELSSCCNAHKGALPSFGRARIARTISNHRRDYLGNKKCDERHICYAQGACNSHDHAFEIVFGISSFEPAAVGLEAQILDLRRGTVYT